LTLTLTDGRRTNARTLCDSIPRHA